MKTIAQTLVDEIHYPLPLGFVENKLMGRGLDGESEISAEIITGNQFKGAVADCLWSLLQAPNISESDKSVSLPSQDSIIKLANSYYREIGEPEKTCGEPTVQFGW
ncbi:MAG: hypothetical protein NC095_06240 [Muribaculum sp.]|nr:hypothetical protein [Muribaculum sp.]